MRPAHTCKNDDTLSCWSNIPVSFHGDHKHLLSIMLMSTQSSLLESRYHLGVIAYNAGKQHMELAMKHWIIAAEAGYVEALNAVKLGYKHAYATKKYLQRLCVHINVQQTR